MISAGDLIGASPLLSALFHDEPTIESMNKLGLDINAVGNHEFDEGAAELLRMQDGGCHPTDGCQDGNLLMPRAWVLERFRGEPEALGTAKALAESSRASLAASVLRLRELLDWNSSLLHWRRSERGWQLSSTAGLPRGVRVTSAKTTSLVLDQIGSSPADATAEIPLAVAGRPTQASMEISVRGRSAIALAALNCFESSRDRDPLLARLEHARWGL